MGLFAAKCPLEADAKLWVEQRLCWLAEVLGFQRMLQAPIVLPTPEWFPERYKPTEESIDVVFHRVCELMQLDASRFELSILDDNETQQEGVIHGGDSVLGLHSALGSTVNRRAQIAIHWGEAGDPMSLVATVAHELSHAILLGGGHISAYAVDHEHVTDLTTAFLGFGIFSANSVVREGQFSYDGWHSWQTRKKGYLNELNFAYALAVLAYARDEARPTWTKYLRPNVQKPFRQSLQYLAKTGDCWLQPSGFEQLLPDGPPPPPSEIFTALHDDSAGARLTAVRWMKSGAAPQGVAEPLIRLLRDRDFSVRSEAAELLGSLGAKADDALDSLSHLLGERDPRVRSLAIKTMGQIADQSHFLAEVASMLNDSESLVRTQALLTLGRFAEHAASQVPTLVTFLDRLHDDTAAGAARSLAGIGPEARPAVPHLINVIYRGEGESRVAAAEALGKINAKSEDVFFALHRAADDEDHEVRYAALNSLYDLAPLYQESLPPLEKAMRHDDPETRLRAARAMSTFEDGVPQAVQCLARSSCPPLTESVDEPHGFDERLYTLTASIVLQIGPAAVSELETQLASENTQHRLFAVWALSLLGLRADAALPALRRVLPHSSGSLPHLISHALWNAGAEPSDVIPLLLEFARANAASEVDPFFHVCDAGRQAWGRAASLVFRISTLDHLYCCVAHVAIREIGEEAVSQLIRPQVIADDALAHAAVRLLAAIDLASESNIISREQKELSHDLKIRSFLSQARDYRERLVRERRAYQLFMENVPRTSEPRGDQFEQIGRGKISEATWLLLEGLTWCSQIAVSGGG